MVNQGRQGAPKGKYDLKVADIDCAYAFHIHEHGAEN